MSVFKKLKSIFIVEEEEPEKKKKTPPRPETPKKAPRKELKNIIPTQNVTGNTDEKFVNILFEALERNNVEGYDYLEFMNAVKSLEKMNMDEATRFKSAYTLAQTMGVTPQKLEETALHYLKVLDQEEQKFQAALQKKQQNGIEKRRQAIEQSEQAISEKTKTIAQLQKEIEQHKEEISRLKNELDATQSKVEYAAANFRASLNMIADKIRTDLEKMKKYLK